MGHGKSDAPETGYSRADRVEHLRAFVAALSIERFHLVGLSMGGTTAIGYALRFGEQLESLTLVSTAVAGWKASNKVSLVDRLAREKGLEVARRKWKQITLLYYKHEHQDIKQLMEEMVDDHSGAIWLDPMRGKYNREYDLEKVHEISVPTMIMVGSLDRIFVPLAHTLHEQIPESRLLVYENVGHMLNMEQPDRFNADLDAFLKQGDK
jgi:pimeloyl-ACP methyl ester carboxylesterase